MKQTSRKAKAKRGQDLADISVKAKKIEPFYFDANRGPNAHSRHVGFATNDLNLQTLAAPAVELLTLVGLQRAIPAPVPDMPRHFYYGLWTRPLPVSLLSAAVNTLLSDNTPIRSNLRVGSARASESTRPSSLLELLLSVNFITHSNH